MYGRRIKHSQTESMLCARAAALPDTQKEHSEILIYLNME